METKIEKYFKYQGIPFCAKAASNVLVCILCFTVGEQAKKAVGSHISIAITIQGSLRIYFILTLLIQSCCCCFKCSRLTSWNFSLFNGILELFIDLLLVTVFIKYHQSWKEYSPNAILIVSLINLGGTLLLLICTPISLGLVYLFYLNDGDQEEFEVDD